MCETTLYISYPRVDAASSSTSSSSTHLLNSTPPKSTEQLFSDACTYSVCDSEIFYTFAPTEQRCASSFKQREGNGWRGTFSWVELHGLPCLLSSVMPDTVVVLSVKVSCTTPPARASYVPAREAGESNRDPNGVDPHPYKVESKSSSDYPSYRWCDSRDGSKKNGKCTLRSL